MSARPEGRDPEPDAHRPPGDDGEGYRATGDDGARHRATGDDGARHRAPGAAALPALVVLVLGAWVARAPAGPSGGEPLNPGEPALEALPTAELAGRARALQLALATGQAPDRDRYLAHRAGAVVPFSPVSTALLAALARRLAGGDAGPVDDADELELERLLTWLPRLGGALAALAAFLAARRTFECTLPAALAVAAAAALIPPLAVAERGGAAGVEPFAAALLYLMLALLGGLRRARDLSEATLAGMLAGLAGGLAVLLSSTALPLYLAAGAALFVRAGTTPEPAEPVVGARSPRADAWRAWLLFVMAAVAVVELPPLGASTLSARLALGAGTAGWWARALMPALPVALALALGSAGRGRRAGALLAAAVAVLLVPLGAPLRAAGLHDGSARAETGRELARALEWLRLRTPSPGPFNHPGAAQDWCVLTAPALGAAIAYRGRRPVLAARFPAVFHARAETDAQVALAALAGEDSAEAALALRELGVRYLLITPRMARSAPEGSILHRLAFGEDEVPGLERVYASDVHVDTEDRAAPAARGPTGPAVSIHRAELAPRTVPGASPVR